MGSDPGWNWFGVGGRGRRGREGEADWGVVADAIFVHEGRRWEGGGGDRDEAKEPRGERGKDTINTMFILTGVGEMGGGISMELRKRGKQGGPSFVPS